MIEDKRTYCSLRCRNVYVNTYLKDYSKISRILKDKYGTEKRYTACPKMCKQCKKMIPYEKRDNEFCNSSCGAIYNNSRKDYSKYVLSDAALKNIRKANKKVSDARKEKYEKNPMFCQICKKILRYDIRNNKTCGTNCYKEYLRKMAIENVNCGGETNYKTFVYKNIRMDSSWEVIVAKWMDKNKIGWIRDRKVMFQWTDKDGKRRRYYPDFYVPSKNIYIDTKNKYLMSKDKYKLHQVIKEHKIKLISGDVKKVLVELQKLGFGTA